LSPVVFSNVRVLDVRKGALTSPTTVLVRGGLIERIGDTAVPGDATRIDGTNRVLMPGLIDAHWHAAFAAIPQVTALTADSAYIHLVAGEQAKATLLRGFTTVRDCGGPTFGLKRAIDEGILNGPRIFPSGAFISQTSGHGDFRTRHEVPAPCCAPLSYAESMGAAMIADGPDAVMRRVREQLMLGASQIKLTGGGGVASPHDPIDVAQYTEAEFRAAVDAAENWGTYVTVHAYTPRAIRTAVAGGVRCIEHGHLADEATADLMAEKGIWWSLQPFLDDEDAIPMPAGTPLRKKQLQVIEGTDTAYALAKKYKVRTAWGTDTLFDAKLATRQGAQLAKMTRWYTPAEVLRMATLENAELLSLAGERNSYPGKLGEVSEGALADLLLVEGDPLANISLLADPQRNIPVIMKGGRLYKRGGSGAEP
jgi:imidazolonepropionase-like amidohydrolase